MREKLTRIVLIQQFIASLHVLNSIHNKEPPFLLSSYDYLVKFHISYLDVSSLSRVCSFLLSQEYYYLLEYPR